MDRSCLRVASLLFLVSSGCAEVFPPDGTGEDAAVVDGTDAGTSIDAGADAQAPSDGGTDAGSAADASTPPVNVYQEVYERGLLAYVDDPALDEVSADNSLLFPNIYVHRFVGDEDGGRGPLCMRGADYYVETREGASDALMIFLEGGGVCLTEICAATVAPALSLRLFTTASVVGIGGLLDARNEDNPVADYDIVNAPYCDGSLFGGDVDRILSDGNAWNGTDDMAYQRGLQNLTATIKTAYDTFPNPSRIVLVGSSGGAYGVIFAVALARFFYPDIPITVLSDSGAPIVNGYDTDFIRRALDEFNALKLVPPSCTDCIADGHARGIVEWALAGDPGLTVAYTTHSHDHVIGGFFMGTTEEEFAASVVSVTNQLRGAFPDRFFRFVVPSNRHTLAMGLGEVSVALQQSILGLGGALALTGDDVSSEELAKWSLGGMTESGVDANGVSHTGYEWFRAVLETPENVPDVLDVGP